LMLNAVNLTFVTFARMLDDIGGQVFVFFTLVVAAAEVVVGLALIVSIFRRRQGATADDVSLLRGLGKMSAVRLAWLIPAFPLAGVVILFLARRFLKEPLSGWIATLMMVGAFVSAVVVFSGLHSLDETHRQVALKGVDWINAAGFSARFNLLVDPLSIT